MPNEPAKMPVGTDAPPPWAAKDRPYKPDDPSEIRTQFKHDGDEIIYSAAFRRLSRKSQIVVRPEHQDHFRSRLTHTLEVNQIAESIGFRLRLNTPLVNAITLGHDLGHAPFGHAGEREFQRIMRSDILPLCDIPKLKSAFESTYGVKDIAFEDENGHRNCHWLFHHATNSVRLVQRKLKDITRETREGIMCHSWSPWQGTAKFGVPKTYEGQVAAIADQIAGINHDTEDILNCAESEHDLDKIREDVPTFIANSPSLSYEKAHEILDAWFLPGTRESSEDNGWSRKKRLQKILNDICESSLKFLKEKGKEAAPPSARLSLSDDIGSFLAGYEKYVRQQVIEAVPWFRIRDGLAATVIRAVYTFYKHCAWEADAKTFASSAETEVRKEIEKRLEKFQKSVADDDYDHDDHMKVFRDSAKPGKHPEVEHAMKAMDYVAGMTDNMIMEVYQTAFGLFK